MMASSSSSSLASPPPYPKATEATVQIKIEPVEAAEASNPTRFGDVKPFEFGVGVARPNQPPPPAYPGIKEEPEHDVNVKMEPVLSLAMEQVKRDISNACKILNISPSEYSNLFLSLT